MMSESSSFMRRRIASLSAIFAAILLLVMIGIYTVMEVSPILSEKWISATAQNMHRLVHSATHRKLLNQGSNGNRTLDKPDRVWGKNCSKSDIVIIQGPMEPLPNGIPTYTVEIMNFCVSGCDISSIHLNCGWFSSARIVNPRIFKRVKFDDCLVNEGKPLLNGHTVSFRYANTFHYPFSVASVSC